MAYQQAEKKGNTSELPHRLVLEERGKLQITGVKEVGSFDEQTITLRTVKGEMVIKGDGLHIGNLNVDTGELWMEGRVDALVYRDTAGEKGGFWSRLLR